MTGGGQGNQPQGQPQGQSQGANPQAPTGQQPGGPQQIQITEEQLQQIQQLVTNPVFENLRQQARSNPQILPQLLQMLQQNHPALHQLFTQNPQLLIAILMGNVPGVEGEEGDDEAGGQQAVELSEEDYQVIQNVS